MPPIRRGMNKSASALVERAFGGPKRVAFECQVPATSRASANATAAAAPPMTSV